MTCCLSHAYRRFGRRVRWHVVWATRTVVSEEPTTWISRAEEQWVYRNVGTLRLTRNKKTLISTCNINLHHFKDVRSHNKSHSDEDCPHCCQLHNICLSLNYSQEQLPSRTAVYLSIVQLCPLLNNRRIYGSPDIKPCRVLSLPISLLLREW